MKFLANSEKPEKIVKVTLDQSGDDTNILLDGILVAWLDGSDGRLYTYGLSEDEATSLCDCGVDIRNNTIVVNDNYD